MTPPQPRKAGVWLSGSSGRMGLELQKALQDHATLQLVGGSARTFEGAQFYQGRRVTRELLAHVLASKDVDVILDFSHEAANELLLHALETSEAHGKAVLLGTTGLDAERLEAWQTLARGKQLKVLIAPNTSLGILLTVKAALLAAKMLSPLGFDIELTETHHRGKKDAPSGTALFIADTIVTAIDGLHTVDNRSGARQGGELGLHSVRGGGVAGEHEVRFLGDNEEIRISHRAFNRALFARGALVLTDWLCRQKSGTYGLLDIKPEELAAP